LETFSRAYNADVFDLITALVDSWTLWKKVADLAANVPGAKGMEMPDYWHNQTILAALNDACPVLFARSLRRPLERV
jgi:hypothetical protein